MSHTLLKASGVILLLVVFLLFAHSGTALAVANTNLFTPVANFDASRVSPENELTLLRNRFVTVDFARLSADRTPAITLNLFDDVTIRPVLVEAERMENGGYVWQGYIEGMPEESSVALSVFDNTLQGNIAIGIDQYQIRYVEGNVHSVRQVNPFGYGTDGEPISIDLGGTAPEDFVDPAGGDGENMAPTIRVLVAYTDDARSAAGGTSAMTSLINLAISETNTGYANSGVNQRLALARTQEYSYAETGNMNTDLSRIRSTSDGYLDGVHSLRNTYTADMVAFIVNNGGSYCGLAYLMTSVSNAFKTNAFSVIDKDCATGYYSFGHELGHNMGARHDSYVDSGTTPYAYSHGWVNVPDRWRSIMAYNNRCSDSGVSCTRINYWSNTTRTRGGDPMGNASTANNARVLNNTANTVAGWR